MTEKKLSFSDTSLFKRRHIFMRQPQKHDLQSKIPEVTKPAPPPAKVTTTVIIPSAVKAEEDCTVLVINSSHDMAKEITLQLTLDIPSCSIMYAPTIEIAKWILQRRKIHLVVSSPVLPDGSVSKLKDALQKMSSRPDVVVVGHLTAASAELFEQTGYEFAQVKRLCQSERPSQTPEPAPVIHRRAKAPTDSTIKGLGADIRNDLNNPLQEIVAMVFVAKNGASQGSPATDQALSAIDKAAKRMANVVSSLEDKIREAITVPQGSIRDRLGGL